MLVYNGRGDPLPNHFTCLIPRALQFLNVSVVLVPCPTTQHFSHGRPLVLRRCAARVCYARVTVDAYRRCSAAVRLRGGGRCLRRRGGVLLE